jgi:hypothetical protein
MLMNSQFMLDQATRFAERLKKDAGEDRTRQVARAWQLAFTRPPTEKESTEALDFLSRQEEHLKKAAEKANTEKKEEKPEKKEEKTAKEEKPKKEKSGKDQPKSVATLPPELQALTDLCQALLSANEFLYVD